MTWSSTSQVTWAKCFQKKSATTKLGSMANAIGPMSLGLGQFLMIAKQPSKNASSGDWTRIQSTPSKNTMNGLVVGMKHLLMPWRHTCRSKPPSESWPRCLEKPFVQRSLEKLLEAQQAWESCPQKAWKSLPKAWKSLGPGELRAKLLGKACWSAWMGLHGCCFLKQCLLFKTNESNHRHFVFQEKQPLKCKHIDF